MCAWRGHIEFWTREDLAQLHARVAGVLSENDLTLFEDRDPRLVLTCPFGNMLVIRPAPDGFEVRGDPPGGYGKLVAISRVVWHVHSGTAAAVRAFWVGVLGSAAECKTVADGRISFCMAHFGSGQQLVFEERRDEEGNDTLEPRVDAPGSAANDETALASRQHLIFYVQSREAFRSAFMAAAAKNVLRCSPEWSDVEANAEFSVTPAPDAASASRLSHQSTTWVRLVGTPCA